METKSKYRKIKYNENKIKTAIEKFKELKLKPEDISLIFDMDNTLCLFSYSGQDEEALTKMWNKNFFRNLQCFEEAGPVIESLQKMGFKIKILSACITNDFCRKEKLEWVHYHLPSIKDEDIIFVNKGENKADYIDDISKSILIDDYYINIMDWYDAGGIAIKKTFSNKKRPVPQVHSLIEIFNFLFELDILGPLN